MPLVTNDLLSPAARAQGGRQYAPVRPTQVRLVTRGLPADTFSPSQTAGVRYERRVGEYLAEVAHNLGANLLSHPWIEYDGNLAQPDFLLVFPSNAAILFEVKYTWVDCRGQLGFYSSLLSALGLNPLPCTVCRNLTPATPSTSIIQCLSDLTHSSVWHLRR